MRIAAVLLACVQALVLLPATQALSRAPWLEKKTALIDRQPTRARAAPARRAEVSQSVVICTLPFPCCTSSTPLKQLPPAEEQQPPANEESVEVINLVEPVNKRRLPADSLYEGEILEPQHAARFLLSGTGSYLHDNGTLIIDDVYQRMRRSNLAQHAQKGLISARDLEEIDAYTHVADADYLTPAHYAWYGRHDHLWTISSKTSVPFADLKEVLNLLLEHEFEHITVGGLRVKRAMLEALEPRLVYPAGHPAGKK